MVRCRHTGWLRAWKTGSELGVEITDRPQRLLEDFQDPHSDCGSLLLLIGNKSKRAAFSKLSAQNKSLGTRGNGETHLFASSFKDDRNLRFLIADADIPRHSRLSHTWRTPSCHNAMAERFPAIEAYATPSEIGDRLFHQALFPFADVVCLFVEDIGGIEMSISRLTVWVNLGRASNAPIRPRLFLIVNKEDQRYAQMILREFKSSMDQSTLEGVFQSISILGVPTQSSKKSRRKKRCRIRCWDVVRHEILKSLEVSRQIRRQSGYLFSIQHLAAFLHQGASLAVHVTNTPVDFIKLSRLDRGIASDLPMHLTTFLNQFQSLATLKQIAIPLIASSLLLDHYPPGMHSFRPCDVFNALYSEACLKASGDSIHVDGGSFLPTEIVKLINDSMVSQYAQVQLLGSSVVDWHRLQLAQFRYFMSKTLSNKTCLCCIRREPQYTLQCGHSICQNCVKAFHRLSDHDPWVVQLNACQICTSLTQNVLIRLVPETTRIRVLSIDGGGIRGSAPIAFLKAIQDEIDIPNYQVQRHFDVKFGTSSGALSVISLDILGWTVEECMCYFKSFAERCFQDRIPMLLRIFSKVPVISDIARFFYFLYIVIVDGKYSANELETLLRETCGLERTLTDCSSATEMGTQVGVTLTKAHNGKAIIATNYNGVGDRPSHRDYDILLPDAGHDRVMLWEILRCATAAPFYFKSRDIGNLGAFQDGGLAYNNPTSIALREVAALYPNAPEPSLVLSLGTGSSLSGEDETTAKQSWWVGKFPFRLSRALWRQVNSQVAWNELLGHRESSSRTQYFRFNVDFGKTEPPLDAVEDMDEVGRLAHDVAKGSFSLRHLAQCLRAELFFFELDGTHPPQFTNSCFTCVGYIKCRLRAGTTEYREFIRQLHDTSAVFQIGNRKYEFTAEDVGKNFDQQVRFTVPNLKDSFDITLLESEGDCCHISGSPFTLEWLIRMQGLDAWFGTNDHRKRKISSGYMRLDVKRQRLR
ncbi:acyl transferase/acyl hydrolase/lysophospholipase [Mariannaea sp. PMI_226]|nr:acyl transferase/acyl hydrolase/lysophospholipase [Mariannaea sp. PMI_226]